MAEAGTMDALLDDAEWARRRAEWRPRATDYQSGAIWKFAQLVGPAHLGAVTHPGAPPRRIAMPTSELPSETLQLVRFAIFRPDRS